MAFTANTAFEVKNSNIRFNDIQNVPGYFGAVSEGAFVPADCSAGTLCASSALAPSEGYESVTPAILNGNTHQFILQANGKASFYPAAHTAIYACNTHDVQQLTAPDGNVYNVGANTLGLGLPAGNRCAFTELIVGERYKFGAGNFSTLPTTGQGFATISNGFWVGAAAAPAAGNVYAVIEREEGFEKGVRYAFDGYVLRICRA